MQFICNELAVLGTIEFYDKKNELVFQTTEEEKSHLVLQLGAPTGAIAVEAAKVVYTSLYKCVMHRMDDVSAIDINMGCPKQFSVQGNMGSALLKTPDIACEVTMISRGNG